jgi:hypothetical protein
MEVRRATARATATSAATTTVTSSLVGARGLGSAAPRTAELIQTASGER